VGTAGQNVGASPGVRSGTEKFNEYLMQGGDNFHPRRIIFTRVPSVSGYAPFSAILRVYVKCGKNGADLILALTPTG